MMWGSPLISLVRNYLPQNARLVKPQNPVGSAPIQMADLDGDGIPEMIVSYKVEGQPYITVLKSVNGYWTQAGTITGKGYDIHYLATANVTGGKGLDLLTGWQMGAIWSELHVYSWIDNGLIMRKPEIVYSLMELVPLASEAGPVGMDAIAVWTHVTGEAYTVELYVWNGTELAPAPALYPMYFPKVVSYYSQKVKEMPDAAFLWYYLADAQIKAGMKEEAIASIQAGLKLQAEYPPKEEFLKLLQAAQGNDAGRRVALYPASIQNAGGVRWGYINGEGRMVLPPLYTLAHDFQENGLAVVVTEKGAGVIDTEGRYIVPPQYADIYDYADERAVVVGNQGFALMDEKGELLTPWYTFISSMSEGRAAFAKDGGENWKYGYLDKAGKEVIPAQYESAGPFRNGKALVQVGSNLFRLIDPAGNTLVSYNYAFVGEPGDGLLPFKQTQDGKFGFINEQGQVVIPPSFIGVESFKNGLAVVNAAEDYNARMGVIDTTGRYIIPASYNDIITLGEGMFAVGIPIYPDMTYAGSKYAIADSQGRILTQFVYYGVSPYQQGLASAYDNTQTFFIDKTGKRVTSLPAMQGVGTLQFVDSIIQAQVDNRRSYLDRSGKVIWSQNTIIPLGNGIMVNEIKYRPNRNYLVYYPQIAGMKNMQAQNTVNAKLRELSAIVPVDADAELDYSYQGDFSITFYRKNLLELLLTGYSYPFGAAHGMPSQVYAHIDLVTGAFYQLKDLFKPGSDYVKVLSDIIRQEIEHNPEYSYVWPDSYKGIDANQPFYVQEDALYIYFTPYEIAPYAAGFPTFRIPYQQIIGIIDTNGAFWKSFHEV